MHVAMLQNRTLNVNFVWEREVTVAACQGNFDSVLFLNLGRSERAHDVVTTVWSHSPSVHSLSVHWIQTPRRRMRGMLKHRRAQTYSVKRFVTYLHDCKIWLFMSNQFSRDGNGLWRTRSSYPAAALVLSPTPTACSLWISNDKLRLSGDVEDYTATLDCLHSKLRVKATKIICQCSLLDKLCDGVIPCP